MSFLSKFGEIVHKVEGVLESVSPVAGLVGATVKALIPGNKEDKVVDYITNDGIAAASNVVKNVEAFGQALSLPGADKLKAAAGPMAQVLLQSSVFAGKKIKDPELFKQGATKIADGMADCWNAVDDSEVKVAPL